MYWVFNEEQLERALNAFAQAQCRAGVSQHHIASDAHQIREFLKSPAAREHKLVEDGK